jgi:hypothetical protein
MGAPYPVIEARRNEAFDYRQFKAILRLALIGALRPALDAKTGKIRSHPLRTMIFAYGFIGFFFVRNAAVFSDLRSYLIVLFSYVLNTAMLTALPDSAEMERRFELVCSKPVGSLTMTLARAASVLVVESILVFCLALVPLVALRFTHGTSISVSLLLAAAILSGAFALTMFWMTVIMLLAQRLRVAQLRWASQLLLGTIALLLSLPLILPRAVMAETVGDLRFDSGLVRLLPSTWLVDAVIGGFDAATNLERGALAVSFLALAIAVVKTSAGTSYMDLLEGALRSEAVRARLPYSARLLRPLYRARLLSKRAGAVATLILAHASRDEVGARRLLGFRLALIVTVAFNILALRLGYVGAATTTILGFLIAVEGVRLSTQSQHAAASWMFEVAPIDPREALKGLRVAVWLGYFAFPFAVTSALVAAESGLLEAFFVIVACALEADVVISVAIALDPCWPLSHEEQKMPPIFGRFLYMFVFAILIGVRTAVGFSPTAIAIYLALLALAVHLCRRWARRRFEVSVGSGP